MPNQESMNALYVDRLAKTGTLYTNPNSQLLRFQSIIDAVNLEGQNVLDVGCGTGTFVEFLKTAKIKPKSYKGIDILSQCVDKAIALNKDAPFPVSFERCPSDYADKPYGGFDVVIGVGLLELKFDEDPVRSFTKAMAIFERMISDAKLAAVTTFLSSHMKNPLLEEAPIGAGQVYEYIKRCMANPGCCHVRIAINDSFAPHVYTVAVFKGPSAWESHDRLKKEQAKKELESNRGQN